MSLQIISCSRDKRFGRITEGKIERWYGYDVFDSLKLAATGCHIPILVMGVPASLFRGEIIQHERAPYTEILRRMGSRLVRKGH